MAKKLYKRDAMGNKLNEKYYQGQIDHFQGMLNSGRSPDEILNPWAPAGERTIGDLLAECKRLLASLTK